MKCENCSYWWKEDTDKHPRCYFTDWRGEPSWLDVPPCHEEDYADDDDSPYVDADVMEELDQSDRKSYREDIKPLLELLNHIHKREEVDPNWDMVPIVFGYDGRMAITYNAYAYEPLMKALEECLDGIDEMYNHKFNWKKEEVRS